MDILHLGKIVMIGLKITFSASQPPSAFKEIIFLDEMRKTPVSSHVLGIQRVKFPCDDIKKIAFKNKHCESLEREFPEKGFKKWGEKEN